MLSNLAVISEGRCAPSDYFREDREKGILSAVDCFFIDQYCAIELSKMKQKQIDEAKGGKETDGVEQKPKEFKTRKATVV